MNKKAPKFKNYIFVCEKKRENGECCGLQGEELRALLKAEVLKKGLSGRVRVVRSGCLDSCSEGPNILIEPQHAWFNHVQKEDIDQIIEKLQDDGSTNPL